MPVATIQIVPRVVEGPWVIKKGVGTVPCLLGQKVANIIYNTTSSTTFFALGPCPGPAPALTHLNI